MIIIEKVKCQNFLSIGNSETEFVYSEDSFEDAFGLRKTLVVGPNGSGKSTLPLESLCFVLFNKSFRGVNKSQFVNSTNKKGCLVTVTFHRGNSTYEVVRGIKPNVFKIIKDGIELNADSSSTDQQKHLENVILGFDYKTFIQIAVLGSASYTPFMLLSASERRSFVESVLSLQIFSEMAQRAKQERRELQNKVNEIRSSFDVVCERAKVLKKVMDDHQTRKEASEAKRMELVEQLESERSMTSMKVESVKKKIQALPDQNAMKKKINEFAKQWGEKSSDIRSRLTRIDKDKKFFSENSVCSSCGQDIDEQHKKEHLNKLMGEEAIILLERDEVNEMGEKLEKMNSKYESVQDKEIELGNELRNLESSLRNVERRMKELEEDEEPDVSGYEGEFESARQEAKKLHGDKKVVEEELRVYDLAVPLLKDDAIKASVIRHYIPEINRRVNHYLELLNFPVRFELDENFNEVIKSHHRKDFSYNSFSMGERARIDLAVMFTWRDIARQKAKLDCNLLIMDEVFDGSVDGVGASDLLSILDTLDEKTNVVVISHRGDQIIECMDRVIEVSKVKGFSRYKEMR